MLIGVPLETAAGETRVAVTPETAKKYVAQGHSVRVTSGAGLRAAVTDAAYQAAGAQIVSQAEQKAGEAEKAAAVERRRQREQTTVEETAAPAAAEADAPPADKADSGAAAPASPVEGSEETAEGNHPVVPEDAPAALRLPIVSVS